MNHKLDAVELFLVIMDLHWVRQVMLRGDYFRCRSPWACALRALRARRRVLCVRLRGWHDPHLGHRVCTAGIFSPAQQPCHPGQQSTTNLGQLSYRAFGKTLLSVTCHPGHSPWPAEQQGSQQISAVNGMTMTSHLTCNALHTLQSDCLSTM